MIAPPLAAPIQPEWIERPAGDQPSETAAPMRSLELIRASELEVRPVSWLWPERVPIGALTVLAGEPGLGKSLLSIHVAARLSRGELGGTAAASLFLTAEDPREQVVLPRLVAAGADLDRVVFPPRGRDTFDETIRLPDDVGRLGELVATAGVKLIVIDPLVAHLPAKVNSWQDQSVRGALAPLAALAEEHETAVLLIAHLNKGQGSDPLRRLGGSIGLPAAARSVLLLARDPDDREGATGSGRVLAHVKSNLGVLAPSVAFELDSTAIPSAVIVDTPYLREVGPSPFSAQELLALNEPDMRSKSRDADALLRAELEHGPRLVSELRTAAKEQGISITTLERAKKQVGAQSVKLNLHEWAWQLPPGEHKEDEPAAA